MKIILQPEATTISNYELAKNQEYLVSILTKIFPFIFKRDSKNIQTKTCGYQS